MKKIFVLLPLLAIASSLASCARTQTTSRAQALEPTQNQSAGQNQEQNQGQAPEFAKYRDQGFELIYKKDSTKEDAKNAFDLFQKAAEFNDPVSIDVLGGFYTSGIGGVERSCKKAIEMYSKAALLGYPLSVNNLAYSLVTCPDPKQRNPERAKKLVQNLFQQSPFFLALLDTYAAALAESKEKTKAVVVQKTVIDIAQLMEIEPERLSQLRKSLAAYEKGKGPPASFEADAEKLPKKEKN